MTAHLHDALVFLAGSTFGYIVSVGCVLLVFALEKRTRAAGGEG